MIAESQGVILKVFPYSNTSVILNVFTKERGKLTFIAKGIRKPKNGTSARTLKISNIINSTTFQFIRISILL